MSIEDNERQRSPGVNVELFPKDNEGKTMTKSNDQWDLTHHGQAL